jgi:hypothetical protein
VKEIGCIELLLGKTKCCGIFVISGTENGILSTCSWILDSTFRDNINGYLLRMLESPCIYTIDLLDEIIIHKEQNKIQILEITLCTH